MGRYITAWIADNVWIRNDQSPSTVTVMQPEPAYRDTGLLDQTGSPLYALDEPSPVGYHLDQWRGRPG